MKKRIFLTAIVLVIIGYFLIDSWITIFRENYIVKWQHITGLLLFLPLPLLFFRKYKIAVLATGIYLALGFFRLLSLTAAISTGSITIVGLEISGFNWLAFGLLILFLILHLDILIELQLDDKESKSSSKNP